MAQLDSFLDPHFAPADISAVLKLIALLSKGILRDIQARRKFMFWVMAVALLMLFCGSVFLSDSWAREHPWLFLAYWFICGWLTLTGMAMALFDILIVKTAHRVARRKLEKQLLDEEVENEKRK